jgi:hypothetical protein
MSGTSMSTPITAGNALLVRQYFMDPKHWATMCSKDLPHCMKTGFTPSGYLLKAIFLHSGEPVKQYSDPIYDEEPTRFPSFELKSKPLDVFQGHGAVRLSNILPLPDGKGLDPRLDLFIWDELKLSQHETLRFDITLPEFPSSSHAYTAASSSTSTNYGTTSGSTSSSTSSNSNMKGNNLPIKVTLCWFDPPSPMGSVSSLLLHDIDLVVQAPDGSLHWGNANAADGPTDAGSATPEAFKYVR